MLLDTVRHPTSDSNLCFHIVKVTYAFGKQGNTIG